MEYPYVDEEKELVYFNENMIVEQFVDVKWNTRNKTYAVSQGYKFTKMGDVFTIDTRHLSKGSGIRVFVVCPMCTNERDIAFEHINRYNHTKCRSCASIIDRAGIRYERLIPVKIVGKTKAGHARWLCKCDCGNMTVVSSENLQSGSTHSCGCLASEVTSERMKKICGEKGYRWNPDLTDEEREIGRNYPEMVEWSKDIKELNSFVCQCCGDDKGGNLVSHHLNNYSDFPEQRLDLDNGVTLCESCHKNFHYNHMGNTKVSCTKDDFIEFCYEYYPDAMFLMK